MSAVILLVAAGIVVWILFDILNQKKSSTPNEQQASIVPPSLEPEKPDPLYNDSLSDYRYTMT